MTKEHALINSAVLFASDFEKKTNKTTKCRTVQRYEAQIWLTEQKIKEQKTIYQEILDNPTFIYEAKEELEKFINTVHEPCWETIYTSNNSEYLGYLLKRHHRLFPGTRYRIIKSVIRLDGFGRKMVQPSKSSHMYRNNTPLYAVQ